MTPRDCAELIAAVFITVGVMVAYTIAYPVVRLLDALEGN